MLGDQPLHALQSEVQPVRFDRLDHAGQRGLGRGRQRAAGQQQRQQQRSCRNPQQCGAAHQFATCSCWIRQRPSSDFTITSVFVPRELRVSDL